MCVCLVAKSCLILCSQHVCVLVAELCPALVTPWTVAHQVSLSVGFSRQEYRSRLSCPSPGDLPNRDRTHVSSVSYIYRVSLVAQLTESAYNARDPSSIPGSGRSPGEGNGYPLQYSWAYLVAQMVKHPPAMQETWV